MKTIDLHTHTTISDGTYTPVELIDYAISKNLSALAITDHDTVYGIMEARKYMTEQEIDNIELISGIEFSTYATKIPVELHIVGLYINENDPLFMAHLNEIIHARTIRNEKMVSKLQEQGFDITLDEINTTATDKVVTRAHFAKLLLEKGYIKKHNEAFEKYIGYDSPCFVKRKKLTTEKAIHIINETGGVPILAHPTLYNLNLKELDELLADLTTQGLKGIEGKYSLYTKSEEKYIHDLAAKHDLVISGGSDFHGTNKNNIDLGTGRGNLSVPYTLLSEIKKHRQ